MQVLADVLPSHSHVRFFFSLNNTRPEFGSARPFVDVPPGWCAFPTDVMDGLFSAFAGTEYRAPAAPGGSQQAASTTSSFLWLAIAFSGDGTASPTLHQMRIEFDHESYLPDLPAIYSEDVTGRDFLLPFLSIFESSFAECESRIAGLPAYFDPTAAKSEVLMWLAECLGQDLKEEWDDDRKREMIRKAFATYAKRGTAAGLRERVQDYAGARIRILEPILKANLWSLDETSTLNFDTMLVPAEAQGAVLGTTATLDHSHLITDAEYGSPLFEDVAHRFTVLFYPSGGSTAKQLADVRRTVDRDKPAHTEYQLCIVRPRMRVGYQADVGIDTIVGGPPVPTRLSESSSGVLVLDGHPVVRLGEGNRIGLNTELY
jgi:phage tail-like protein